MTQPDDTSVAEALTSIAVHLKYLGTGDAATTMGAIEFLAKEVKEGTERIADALTAIADAIASHRDEEETE